jgi:hypothetical protein
MRRKAFQIGLVLLVAGCALSLGLSLLDRDTQAQAVDVGGARTGLPPERHAMEGYVAAIPSYKADLVVVSYDQELAHGAQLESGSTLTLTFDHFCYVALIMKPPSTPIPTPTPTDAPVGEVSIGYILYDARDEHVRIDNAGTSPQDMTDWRIQTYRNVGGGCEPSEQWYTFPAGYLLGPGASVRVHSGPDATDNNPPDDLRWTGAYRWANEGDVAVLYDAVGRVVDTYCYGECCP